MLVLKMSLSLDGYVAPLDGSADWVARDAPLVLGAGERLFSAPLIDFSRTRARRGGR